MHAFVCIIPSMRPSLAPMYPWCFVLFATCCWFVWPCRRQRRSLHTTAPLSTDAARHHPEPEDKQIARGSIRAEAGFHLNDSTSGCQAAVYYSYSYITQQTAVVYRLGWSAQKKKKSIHLCVCLSCLFITKHGSQPWKNATIFVTMLSRLPIYVVQIIYFPTFVYRSTLYIPNGQTG